MPSGARRKLQVVIDMEIAGQPTGWNDAYLPTLPLAGGDPEEGKAAFRAGATIAAMGLLTGGVVYISGQHVLALIIIGGFVAAAAAISPPVGLFLVVAAFAFDAILQLGTQFFTGTKALAIITAIMFLIRSPWTQLINRLKPYPLRFFIALVLLYAVAFVVFTDVYYLARLINLMVWVLMLGLAVLCTAIPRNFKQLRVVCLAATLGGGMIGAWVLIFGADSLVNRDVHRLNVGGLNENALAHILGMGLFLSGIAWYGASIKTKAFILFNDLMAVVAIGLSGSRAAWMSLAAAVIAGALLARKVKLQYRALFLIVTIAAGVTGYFLISKIAPDRVYYMLERVQDAASGQSGGRIEWIWPKYWDAFRENPLMGLGPGTPMIIGISSHNDALNILGSSGLLGFILFLGLYITMLRDARRNVVPWLRMVSVAGVVFCFVFGFTHTTMVLKPFAAFVGITACMTSLGLCPKPGSTGLDGDRQITPGAFPGNESRPW